MASGFEVGTSVRVSNQNSIPVRYQGRSGVVVGSTTNSRGTAQYLVSFGARRATPLPLTQRQFRVV
jgi:ribosomal protein L21E